MRSSDLIRVFSFSLQPPSPPTVALLYNLMPPRITITDFIDDEAQVGGSDQEELEEEVLCMPILIIFNSHLTQVLGPTGNFWFLMAIPMKRTGCT